MSLYGRSWKTLPTKHVGAGPHGPRAWSRSTPTVSRDSTRNDPSNSRTRRCSSVTTRPQRESYGECDPHDETPTTRAERSKFPRNGEGRGGETLLRAIHRTPTTIYDEMGDLRKEIFDLRHQLEFIPSQSEYTIQCTNRPPYHSPEAWQAMGIRRRRNAAANYQAEVCVSVAKNHLAAALHAVLEGYRGR